MEQKSRRGLLIGIGSLLIVTFIVGVSYAYWKFSSGQNQENLAKTQCIAIELSDESAGITIEKGYPVSDEEGLSSTPYTFTVTNTCENSIEYSVNLETLGVENPMPEQYIDVQLDENTFKPLNQYGSVDPTYKDNEYEAVDSHQLSPSTMLGAKQSVTHSVRMWMDKDAGVDAQSKAFLSKITVSATNVKSVTVTPNILAYQSGNLLKEIKSNNEINEEVIYSGKEVEFRIPTHDGDNNKYYYALSENGERTRIENGSISFMPTLEGKSVYFFVEDPVGGMSKNYTKVDLYLLHLDDVDYQLAAGKTIDIQEIINSSEEFKFGTSSDNEIASIEGNTLHAKKGGSITVEYTRVSDGATGNIRVNISEILIEKDNGLILLGKNKEIYYDFINSENITATSENENIAHAEIINNKLVVTPVSAGDVVITLQDANDFRISYTMKVANVNLSPNGGSYIIGDSASKIKTNITLENASNASYGWSNSNKIGPDTYIDVDSSEIIKENCTESSYYLWVKISENDEEEIYVSKPFTLFESSIAINPEETNPTRFDFDIEVVYPTEIAEEFKKVGFGKTLEDARNNISAGSRITASENGYVYAEAQDQFGNKITASYQITNIDKIGPTYSEIIGSSESGNFGTIKVTGILDEANKADGYYITQEDTTPNLNDYQKLTGDEITETVNNNGIYYVWIKDNLGNTSKLEVEVSGIVKKVSDIEVSDIYVAQGSKRKLNLSYSGEAKNISYDIEDTKIATISNNGEVIGISAGITAVNVNITNYDGTEETVSSTIFVTSVSLSSTSGITKVGEEISLNITGVNALEYSATSSNEEIAEVIVNGSSLTITPKLVGNVTITVREANGGAEASYSLDIISVEFNVNGGSYQMPSTGKGNIETTPTIRGRGAVSYAWHNSNSTEPTNWTNTTSGTKLIKNDCEAATNYYLWIKVELNGEFITFVSNAFVLVSNTIVITPSVVGYTNDSYNVTISYPEGTINTTRKAGYGSDLTAAITNSASATAPTTIVSVSNNGYVYAEATDSFGNKVTASHQITNFDNITPPTITGGSETYASTRTISVSTAGSAKSGVKTYEYYKSTSNTTPSASTVATGTTSNTVTVTDEGTTYVWYRTVSNGGTKSAWSNLQTVNIYYKAESVTYTNANNSAIKNVKQALDTILGW